MTFRAAQTCGGCVDKKTTNSESLETLSNHDHLLNLLSQLQQNMYPDIQWLVNGWPMAGQWLANGWRMHTWRMVGQCVANAWRKVGLQMVEHAMVGQLLDHLSLMRRVFIYDVFC